MLCTRARVEAYQRRATFRGKKWDDGCKHDEPKKPNGTAGDGKDWDHDGKGNDKEDWDSDGEDGKKRFCKARLFLRKGEALPFGKLHIVR